MKYIGRLKKSLIRNISESLKFALLFRMLTIGLGLVCIAGILQILFYGQKNGFASIFIGFAAAYLIFADGALYLFKNIKKFNFIKFNLTVILKDLFLILVFFIISYKLIAVNFILIAAGITIMPISIAILWLFFPLNFIKFKLN